MNHSTTSGTAATVCVQWYNQSNMPTKGTNAYPQHMLHPKSVAFAVGLDSGSCVLHSGTAGGSMWAGGPTQYTPQ